MTESIKLQSPDKNSEVTINSGELVSYVKNGEELMHQIGSPGWGHTDTEMFPIVGGTVANNYKISTPKGNSSQDQHGLLRELKYSLSAKAGDNATFRKNYKAGSKIKNSKFPDKSELKEHFWPYDFKFFKSFRLTNTDLTVSFEFESEAEMPFMLGYHPAFKLEGNKKESIRANGKSFTFSEVMEVGDRAFPILNTSEIELVKENRQCIKLQTKGFENYMLWSPAANMLCIEPITQYPTVEQKYSEKNMRLSKGKEFFEVKIIS